jgi:hypothetical protein
VIDAIIVTYNQQRPHASLNYLTPVIAHEKIGYIQKRWKKYSKYRAIELTDT